MTVQSMSFGANTRYDVLPSAWFTGLMTGAVKLLRRIDQWQLESHRFEPKTAQEVLDWAMRIEATDPGFAADLRCAALRSMAESEK
jgi:hypothetical protein